MTTAEKRRSPFRLVVGLKRTAAYLATAEGDGETLDSVEANQYSLFKFQAMQKWGKYVRMGMVSVRCVYCIGMVVG